MQAITYPMYAEERALAAVSGRSVLVVDNETVRETLTVPDAIAALEQAFLDEGRGRAVNRTKALIHSPGPRRELWHQYASMEGSLGGSHVVALRVRSHLHNYEVPRADYFCVEPGVYGGLVLLFDSMDGALLAIINDGHIQHLRVAASSALSVKYGAREDTNTLAILGAGGMAVTHAWAIASVRPISRIRIFSPTAAHREELAQHLGQHLGIATQAVGEVSEALRGADVVAACTNSLTPVVRGSLLEPGMHVTTVDAIEWDDSALRRLDRYFVYRSAPTSHHFAVPAEEVPQQAHGGTDAGLVAREADLVGHERLFSLQDLLLGRIPGRVRREDVTGFNSEGTGIQFAALAGCVYERAKAAGRGRELPLAWFTQGIKS